MFNFALAPIALMLAKVALKKPDKKSLKTQLKNLFWPDSLLPLNLYLMGLLLFLVAFNRTNFVVKFFFAKMVSYNVCRCA